jgi:hypothetical protein
MKRIGIFAAFMFMIIASCRKIEVDGNGSNNSGTNNDNVLIGKINTDKVLEAGKIYVLRGIVYLVDGAKLTIPAGTIILGEKSTKGTLVITRGCQIIANGTVDRPVVFTSDQQNPQRGDWGGLVILGKAKTNATFNGISGSGEIEGGVNNAEGLGVYGGTDDADNSGIIRYVRIEYAGYAFLPDKELNGLTLGGVGSGTTIDYVQVSYANDDSFEWFGGSVNAKHLIAYKGLDDDFDMDNGYSGKIQFGISLRDSTIADISGSNGLEIDNDAAGSNAQPQTSATLSNMTIIGPRATSTNIGNSNFKRGAHLRRNSAVSVFNSIVMGWPVGILLDGSTGSPTDLNYSAASPNAFISNSLVAGNNSPLVYSVSNSSPTGWNSAGFLDYFNRAGSGNGVLTTTADAGLVNPFGYSNDVDFNASTGSAASTGADFSNAKLNNPFFDVTTNRGAAGVGDNWWKTWSSFR